jgi:hypothetical protein
MADSSQLEILAGDMEGVDQAQMEVEQQGAQACVESSQAAQQPPAPLRRRLDLVLAGSEEKGTRQVKKARLEQSLLQDLDAPWEQKFAEAEAQQEQWIAEQTARMDQMFADMLARAEAQREQWLAEQTARMEQMEADMLAKAEAMIRAEFEHRNQRLLEVKAQGVQLAKEVAELSTQVAQYWVGMA